MRTYVTRDGRPGVCFFSLDAGSRLAVEAARLLYHLPPRPSPHVGDHPLGLSLPAAAPLLHFPQRLPVHVWWLGRVQSAGIDRG